MKTIVKRLGGILLTLAIIIGTAPAMGAVSNGTVGTVKTQAASYPSVFISTCYASVGEKAYISMQYWPAFNNEELELTIYDSAGNAVATASDSFSNKYASAIQYWTVTWETEGYAAGTYSVEVVKKFYSYYRWNTAPTVSKGKIYLTDDLGSVEVYNSYTGEEKHLTCTLGGSQKASKNTIRSALPAWRLTSFSNYDIQLQEMYLSLEANDLVHEENPYNASINMGISWIVMRFSIRNKSGSTIDAADVLDLSYGVYKFSGSQMTVCQTATFSDNKGLYDVSIEPGETKDVWVGILTPVVQFMPYFLINGTYLNTNPQYFNDVRRADDWFHDTVYEIANTVNGNGKALMSGYANGSGNFGPADPLTRQDFAVILYRLAEEPEIEGGKKGFPDADPNGYYYTSILWAKENKVITGYDNGKFGVGDKITREQVATILYRYAKDYMGLNISDAAAAGDLSGFKDRKSVSAFAKDALTWANGAGIITGKDNGTKIDPQGNAARAEIGAMILRFIKYADQLTYAEVVE